MIGNTSDLSFSNLLSLNNFTCLGFVLDSYTDTLYIAAKPAVDHPRDFEIWMTTINNDSKIYVTKARFFSDMDIYFANRSLYWNSGTNLRKLKLPSVHQNNQNGISPDEIVTYVLPKLTKEFVIDQRRGYIYFSTREIIYRVDMEVTGYRLITDGLVDAPTGMCMDEDDELLFFTHIYQERESIFYYDLRRGTGVHVLVKLDGRNPRNLIFISGWFIWLERETLQACQMSIGQELSVKMGLCRSPWAVHDRFNVHNSQQLSMQLRSVN
ncbi:uncharacterized protein LOC135154126 [Lytechinus pictus]|uniref:uncharacterized protein LOC135154126 n=1 Tax=Lytechinus pictus TaxID=7653 RepID=UPI0030B9FEA9